MATKELCLCGSQLTYQDCCGLYHRGEKTAPTAESLMRSRFTAYAMQNSDYLIATWDSTKCPESINFEKENAQWQRLEIVNTKKGGVKDTKGIVEFKAYFLADGEESVMNEISRFKKVAGHWLYLDGLVKSVGKINNSNNQGKNAPCSCGSGKKFKRCCGK
ncbi:MAG: YchJ family protein [Methylococcaceae bacterium]|nr:YchJ family protein [Methylococcaceae bacterium]